MLGYVMCLVFYTVSAKNILDIFDCNLKTNYQISIIFWYKYSWHDLSSNDCSVFHLTQYMLLHYLGKADQAKYVLK